MAIRQITIIGTGLIGGSIGLAFKSHGFSGRIIGCDRVAVLERAKSKGAIDTGFSSPTDAVRGSNVVILATAVGGIIDLIELLGRGLSPRVLMTDVGSTKLEVMKRARSVFGRGAGKRFLGGHPMAGKEQSGVDFADANLFKGAAWLVTPLPGQNIDEAVSGEYLSWVERFGAK